MRIADRHVLKARSRPTGTGARRKRFMEQRRIRMQTGAWLLAISGYRIIRGLKLSARLAAGGVCVCGGGVGFIGSHPHDTGARRKVVVFT